MFREGVPEGGSSDGEGSVTPGPVLGSDWRGQEVGVGGAEAAGRGVAVEHVGEITGGLVVEGFVGEEEDFKMDALRDGEPVELLKDWGDVVTGASVGQQAGGRVLNVLKFIEDFGR